MYEQVIFAGFGGQGVLSMGKMLAEAGMTEGREVTWLPSYGPEMRGGTSNCSVIIADEEICAPIITQASAVVVMNGPSMDKFESYVQPGGMMFVNSSIVSQKARRTDITTYYVPVNEIAEGLGNAKVANMVMLGAYLAKKPIVQVDTLIEQLKEVLGARKAHLIPMNREAIEKGAEAVK